MQEGVFRVSGKEGKTGGSWKQKACTPDRCAVWQALKTEPERQKEFEKWVESEPPFGYPEQVSAEWAAVLKPAEKPAE